jgi:hypothetical protein
VTAVTASQNCRSHSVASALVQRVDIARRIERTCGSLIAELKGGGVLREWTDTDVRATPNTVIAEAGASSSRGKEAGVKQVTIQTKQEQLQ